VGVTHLVFISQIDHHHDGPLLAYSPRLLRPLGLPLHGPPITRGPPKKQDSGFLHCGTLFWKMQEARVLLTILGVSCYRLPAPVSRNLGCCSSARKNAGSRKQGARPAFLNPASCKTPLSRCDRRSV
jgi:hypothetical protein